MPSRAILALTVFALAGLAFTPAAWAPDAFANVGVSASFDRRSVSAGQIAVATVRIANRGPSVARGVVVRARATGAEIVDVRSASGRCRRGHRSSVRCTVRPLGVGRFPGVTLYLLPATGTPRAVVDARVTSRVTRDPSFRDDDASAAVRITRAVRPSYAEVSFVFTIPRTVVVGRPFTSVLTLLNRGPGSPALVGPVRVTPRPDATVRVGALPRTLRRGEDRDIRVRITPARRGRLALSLSVGATGRATAVVRVR